MEKIGKATLINNISNKTNIKKSDVQTILDSITAEIQASLKKGNTVTLKNFGTFKVQKVAARKGRNIQTGKSITIPAHKKVKFVPGKALTESVYKKK